MNTHFPIKKKNDRHKVWIEIGNLVWHWWLSLFVAWRKQLIEHRDSVCVSQVICPNKGYWSSSLHSLLGKSKELKGFSRRCKGQKRDLIKHENGTQRQPINAWYWVTMSIHLLCCWCWMGPKCSFPTRYSLYPFLLFEGYWESGKFFFLTMELCLLDSLDYAWPLWTQYFVRNHQRSITKKKKKYATHLFFNLIFIFVIHWACEFY